MAGLGCFNGKKVLITGHTGFKGTWLLLWLELLGADVLGVSLPTQDNSYFTQLIRPKARVNHIELDIRDLKAISDLITKEKPDFIFHLAAQAIVKTSYQDPSNTWSTNVMGTLNILESLRITNSPTIAILITSDKCYENQEWVWGYRETDRLGGSDPYSGSKAAAELVIRSYINSYFSDSFNKRK